ncbi:hypothetical protein BX666DRAFT_1873787 [Dichotomocladium elegans]|nr:hypothetical protein BX666DRAFT_1873787 [Dichotomocladium elegans]
MGFVPKRVHSPSDFELIDTEHARKKYISEQFASAMAALSLDHGMKHGDNATTAATAAAALQLPPEEKQKKMAVNLIRANINGSLLPLEQRLGDDKLRIPEFILRPPPLTAADHVRYSARYPTVKWRVATPAEEYKIVQGQDEDDEEIWSEPTAMDID